MPISHYICSEHNRQFFVKVTIVEKLKLKGINRFQIKKKIKEDEKLRERLYEETEFLKNTKYDNFDDRYKFLRLGGCVENYKCPYCGKCRKMSHSFLTETCGKKECQKQNEQRIKRQIYENMSEDTKLHKSLKMKETCLKKYGVEYITQSKIMKERSSKAKLERYGNEKFVNIEKRKNTNKKKYGGNAPLCDENIKRKVLKTTRERYGVDNVFQNENVKEKIRQTNKDKYGVEFPMMSKEIQNKVDYSKSVEKQYISKMKNGTLHTSSHEKKIFEWLKERYGEVKKQYVDKRYSNPRNGAKFKCDFYIVDFDLFIEYQGIFHHGKEPFDKNNKEHVEKLNEWQKLSEKHEKSDYCEAIKVWTIKDPMKREVSKINNLNYLEIWSNKGKLPSKKEIFDTVDKKIKEIEI